MRSKRQSKNPNKIAIGFSLSGEARSAFLRPRKDFRPVGERLGGVLILIIIARPFTVSSQAHAHARGLKIFRRNVGAEALLAN